MYKYEFGLYSDLRGAVYSYSMGTWRYNMTHITHVLVRHSQD